MKNITTCFLIEGKRHYTIKQAYLRFSPLLDPTPTNYLFFYRKFRKWCKENDVSPTVTPHGKFFEEKTFKAFSNFWNLFY